MSGIVSHESVLKQSSTPATTATFHGDLIPSLLYISGISTICGHHTEAMAGVIPEDGRKPSNTVTPISLNCVATTDNSDLPETGQGDGVFPEMVLSHAGASSRRCHKYVKDNIWLSVATTSLLVCMLGNWVLMDVLIRSFLQDVKQGLVLRENSSSEWAHPKVHSYISLYLFMISEPDGDIPTVSEAGPYVYRVEVQKVGVTWNRNSTVSYRQRWTLFYDRARSVAEEPSHLTDLEFVVLFQRNDSVGPMFNVYTGESDFGRIFQTYSWNYSINVSTWSFADSNHRITGTDGSMFQPCMTEGVPLTLFYPQLYRSFEMEYSGLTTYRDLSVYRYTIPDSAFVSSARSCSPGNVGSSNTRASLREGGTYCLHPGLFSVPTEWNGNGVELYISLPHFLGTDPYYHQVVKGLDPQEAKHRPIFDVDKVTGKTVRQKRRFQVNLQQTPSQGSMVYLPLYWAELSEEVGDDELASIRRAREYLRTIKVTCLYVGLSLGLLLTAVLSSLVYKAVKRRTQSSNYRQLHPRPGRQCCKQLKWF